MAADSKNTGLIIGALALGYVALRKQPAATVPDSGNASAPPGGGAAGGGGVGGASGGLGKTIAAGATVAKDVVAVAGPLGAAAGVGAAPAVGALLFEGAGIALGYEQDGVLGAIAGGINPITGNAVLFGANAGKAVANALDLNNAGTTASEASGGVLAGIVTLADLAAAAALLPTVGIVVGLAELLGAVFGIGGGSDPAPPAPAQQVDAAYQIAAGLVQLPPQFMTNEERIQAAAQLVAWAKGPNTTTVTVGAYGSAQIPNLYKAPAGFDVVRLGLGSLLDTSPAGATHAPPVHHG